MHYLSAVLCNLQWPPGSDNPQFPAQIGISIEPLATVSGKEEQISGSKENFAKRYGATISKMGNHIYMPPA
eukprot:1193603-Prorocentrum_minimum.AAC.1